MHNKFQTKFFLESTLENLSKHKLNPTPENYHLWFEYAAESIEELNREINSVIEQQQKFTEQFCRKLYTQYIATQEQREVDETRTSINQLLLEVADHLKGWDSSSEQFCTALNTCIDKLNDEPSITDLKSIISTMTDEAKKVRTANLNIRDTIHTLAEEISDLRQDIDRLGTEALTDELTQAYNRRGFDLAIKEETNKANLESFSCALIVADIDHFKLVNDNFGHQVGDKILKFVAATLKKNIRGNDILARYGGEEFAVILPHTTHEGAVSVAENLRQAVSSRQLSTGSNGQTIGKISMSFGVAKYIQGELPEKFFERADRNMYAAKQQGRDRVTGEEQTA